MSRAPSYRQIILAGAASLAPDEYWCINHDEGQLAETASKDFTYPIRVACTALNADWEDMQEAGFRLGKITLPNKAGS